MDTAALDHIPIDNVVSYFSAVSSPYYIVDMHIVASGMCFALASCVTAAFWPLVEIFSLRLVSICSFARTFQMVSSELNRRVAVALAVRIFAELKCIIQVS